MNCKFDNCTNKAKDNTNFCRFKAHIRKGPKFLYPEIYCNIKDCLKLKVINNKCEECNKKYCQYTQNGIIL